MKAKHFNLIFIFVFGLFTFVAFTNFDIADPAKLKKVKLAKIDEASRLDHAQELLGFHLYKKSNASQLKETKNLNQSLYKYIRASLPSKHKKDARKITQSLIQQSKSYEMDPVFVMAVIQTESSFNPKAVGGVGEIGLMQLRPETAEWIAKKYKIDFKGKKTLQDPKQNIRIGVAYMDYLRSNFENKAGNYVNAYNMGPANVRKLLSQNKKPKEYALKVMKNYKFLYGEIAAKDNVTVASNEL